MFNGEKLTALLSGCAMGSSLIYKETVDSTNLEIKRAALKGAGHGTVVLAEKQTAGRGRRGRSWNSPPGENLYFSLMLCPEFPVKKAAMLTIVMALSVAEAVRKEGLEAMIKWPNDVVADRKKVCGILTELYLKEDDSFYVIVGTGINVNQKRFPAEIKKTATSLAEQKGSIVPREELLSRVLIQFESNYERFIQDGNLSGLRSEYEALLVNYDAQVEVLDPKGAWKGTSKGITDTGELIVRHEDGSIEQVFAGEVSVRGIYGYV